MSYAVDRKSVVDVVYAGYADPASSSISPGLTGHAEGVNGGEYNMDKAKKLMSLVRPRGRAGDHHPDPLRRGDCELLAQIAQQSWQDLGITVHVQKLDDATLVTNRTNGDFEVQVGYATSDVSDTSQMINFLAVTDDSGIRSGYGNPQVKKWSTQALA